MDFKCVFCDGEKGISFSVREKDYYRCSECDGVFMAQKSRLSPEKQKERYLKHNNNLENDGYVKFLESFIKPVLTYINSAGSKCDKISKILDYGSGPEPVLVQLLERYKTNGKLSCDCEVRGWDPFFAPFRPKLEQRKRTGGKKNLPEGGQK